MSPSGAFGWWSGWGVSGGGRDGAFQSPHLDEVISGLNNRVWNPRLAEVTCGLDVLGFGDVSGEEGAYGSGNV